MDGETGVEMALTGIYDVIILDRMLPKLDGIWLHNIKEESNAMAKLVNTFACTPLLGLWAFFSGKRPFFT